MKRFKLSFLFLTVLTSGILAQNQAKTFQPTFESLEKVNPVPEWFKDAKFGIYFHWGVFAVPAFANEWYPRNMYGKNTNERKHHTEVYGTPEEWPYSNFITGAKDKQGNFVQFAPKLKTEGGKFDPEEWAQLFADAGAKFAGPVAEHHDGYSMWNSKVNPWNSKDMGSKLDLAGLFEKAIRKHDMKFLMAMHHAFNITGFYSDAPKTDDPKLQMLYGQQGTEKNEAFWLAKHKEIIDKYHPDIIWQDFNLHKLAQPTLLGFLSYYYNSAQSWGKEVVATYKDGLNDKCGVLDYERGGASDITENYWLTDDAISSSSWCYTEGLKYYTSKAILHGFIDRVSKNGNLLLNISPKADGSIPEGQKEILLSMGNWLKKYGEAIYATRAWNKYGEGATKIGGGAFSSPQAGTIKDIRFTRSKDNKTLYAIFMAREKDQNELVLTSLSADRINLKNLTKVEFINGKANSYITLKYKQNEKGLTIQLPEKTFDDMAYVVKLSFSGYLPQLDNYVMINTAPHYYLVPGSSKTITALGMDLKLAAKDKNQATQWKFKSVGKGYYVIQNRKNPSQAIGILSDGKLTVATANGKDNQVWKIETSFGGLYKISNKQYPTMSLSVNGDLAVGKTVGIANSKTSSKNIGWSLSKVCDMVQEAFKPNAVPGIIEAEDFDKGCPGEAYVDRDEANTGSQYRLDQGVDIEVCNAGGFDVCRTNPGEWLAYTVNVAQSAIYEVSFNIACTSDNGRLHLECDGVDKTGNVITPSTNGRQNWNIVKSSIKLDAGKHILKLVFDGPGLSIDKFEFKQNN
ncbi:MAG: alpha-L-fucosidase [Bacteroidota bacterium]|nr:alpha-L-fucosidase [Bacteroidota bacterium]